MILSAALAGVLGVGMLSRPQVVKQLWVYIKANNLQDPNNKSMIVPDHRLGAVFDRPM